MLRIGGQIAAGLASAHHQGLVHRDIKPANILMDPGVERIKITDFGLARTADDASVTRTGIIAGTPQYMSPEQTRGETLDARSDLFSLGCLMYTSCTGREPFRSETSFGTMRRIAEEEPQPITDIDPEVPDWLAAIVGKLLGKRPDDRFESAEQVSELLEECLAHVQQPAAIPLPESALALTKPQVVPWFSRTGNHVLCALALAGFAALAMMFAGLTNPPEIAGHWKGDDWGEVDLKMIADGKYEGSYSDTFKAGKGKITLKWSRIERRFNGKWNEGDDDRGGKLSVRLVDGQIRGAWTTSENVNISAGVPRLADLLWVRNEKLSPKTGATSQQLNPFQTWIAPARAKSSHPDMILPARSGYASPATAFPPAKAQPALVDRVDPLLGTWLEVGRTGAEDFDPKHGIKANGFEASMEQCHFKISENKAVWTNLNTGDEDTLSYLWKRERNRFISLLADGNDSGIDIHRIEFAADGLWLHTQESDPLDRSSHFLRRIPNVVPDHSPEDVPTNPYSTPSVQLLPQAA